MSFRQLRPTVIFLSTLPWVIVGASRAETPPPKTALPETPEDPKPVGLVEDTSRDPALFSRVFALAVDSSVARRLTVARTYLNERSWIEAIKLLQDVIDAREDVYVRQAAPALDGREVIRWVSARGEALRLLDSMPPAGLKAYEFRFGDLARQLLAEAKNKNNCDLLAEAARRFGHATAGAEAAELLGSYYLDHGHPGLAVRCLERVVDRANATPTPLALFRAALAYRLVGATTRAEILWNRLARMAPNGIAFGAKTLSLDELRRELEQPCWAAPAEAAEAPLFQNDSGHTNDAAPELHGKWQLATAREETTRTWLTQALHQLETRSLPSVPAFQPILAGGRLVYRSHWGFHTLDPASGRVEWEIGADQSLENLAKDTRRSEYIGSWIAGYLEMNPQAVLENALIGSLSADSGRLYAVDDLAVPPNLYSFSGQDGVIRDPSAAPMMMRRIQRQLDMSPFSDSGLRNQLRAFDLETGRPLWERGGVEKRETELSGSYFLGPPLPLSGRLYVLNQKARHLRLVCLDGVTGDLVWLQPLGDVREAVLWDVRRRLHAARLVEKDGILICPTNAGAILAVDVLSRRVLWAQAYDEELPQLTQMESGWGRPGAWLSVPRPPKLENDWKAAAPIIHDGRVIFTAPSAPALHCLDLRDGAVLWEVKRQPDDVYLAGVYHDKVLLVGQKGCRAVSLKDGKPIWSVETGQPSGQGVFGGGVYYVPLQKTVRDKQPAVYGIVADSGAVVLRLAASEKEAPGNLLLLKDWVISQNATTVTAYPRRLEEKEK